MAGGDIAQAGFHFQNKVAAYFASHVVGASKIEFLDLPDNVVPVRIELETTAAVDDILVITSGGGLCFINVKRGVTASKEYKSPLGAVLDQFTRQFLLSEQAQGTQLWSRKLDAQLDRLVLVTGATRSAKFAAAAAKVLARIRESNSLIGEKGLTQEQRSAYEGIVSLSREAWFRHTGKPPTDEKILSLISLIRIQYIDFDTDAAPLSILGRELENPNAAATAWRELQSVAEKLSITRNGADSPSLRNALQSVGIELKGQPLYLADIATLQKHTSQTLKDLQHYSEIQIPGATDEQRFIIERQSTKFIAGAALTQSFLLIGPPGGGKSGALFGAATILSKDRPVVVLAVDQHQVSTPEEISKTLGLHNPIIDVLKNWKNAQPGILFIDALDASRGGPADKAFQLLIRRIKKDVSNWHVVASIRSFDLRFGITYRDLFRGELEGYEDYQDPEFTGVSHLAIPALSDGELGLVWAASPSMAQAYSRAPQQVQQLLRQPFNLYLLGSILLASRSDEGLAGIETQIDLLGRYWSYRVVGQDSKWIARERQLTQIVDLMIASQTLTLRQQEITSDPESIYTLQSEGVLRPEGAVGDMVRAIAFSHHVLFDYTVARLTFDGGQSPDLASRLSKSHDSALMLAPAAIMALKMLWQKEGGARRAEFWKKAFQITSAGEVGSFSKMLPARIAAELVGKVSDYEIAIEALINPQSPDHEAAKFANRHCLGAIAVGIVPADRLVGHDAAEWTDILARISKAESDQVVFSLKPITARLNENVDRLDNHQQQNLSLIGRELLKRYIEKRHWDEGALSVSITAISRTAEHSPEQSTAALKELLRDDNLIAWGHQSLFTLTQEVGHLGSRIPGFVSDLYSAAFGTPLPSQDEKRNMSGSRILNLVTNKRQDRELVQHNLSEGFHRFVLSAPVEAAKTLVHVIGHLSEARSSSAELLTFSFGGKVARYRRDYSSLWAKRSSTYGYEMLDGFRKGIGKLIKAGRLNEYREVVTVIVDENEHAGVWAALLRIGAENPDLAVNLSPLLSALPILSGLDTRQPAGEYLAIVFDKLPEPDRRSIEQSILLCRVEDQRVLLNCLSNSQLLRGDAQQKRLELQNTVGLAKNRPPIDVEAGWVKGDDDWWLREGNVDLGDPRNDNVNQLIKSLQSHSLPDVDADKRAAFKELWPTVVELNRLVESSETPDRLRQQGKDTVMEKCDQIALCCETADQLSQFPGLRSLVIDVMRASEWIDEDEDFNSRGVPSWSRPAPRVQAAEAIIAVARAMGRPDEELRQVIRDTVRDQSAKIRFQIYARINMLYDADPDFLFELSDYCFSNEHQQGVLRFFLNAFSRVIGRWPEWSTEKVVAICKLPPGPREDERDELVQPLAYMLLRLWIRYDQEAARDQIFAWISTPEQRGDELIALLHLIRHSLCQGDSDEFDIKVRSTAREIMSGIIRSCAPKFISLNGTQNLSESARKEAEQLLHILDVAATELYFGSGAYSDKRSSDGEEGLSLDKKRRFISEYEGILLEIAAVAYPSVTHHLMEIVEQYIAVDPARSYSLFIGILGIGTQGGYQFESMGADIAVRVIRRFLADHRAILTSSEENRAKLIGVLDAFVDAGWPDASRLVYELPEMLR